jgi:hypothetical protein
MPEDTGAVAGVKEMDVPAPLVDGADVLAIESVFDQVYVFPAWIDNQSGGDGLRTTAVHDKIASTHH